MKTTCVTFWLNWTLIAAVAPPHSVRHMAWSPHAERWPVSRAVVSVRLMCNKTWHFKSPVCATSDNSSTLALQACGLSSSGWQRAFMSPPRRVVVCYRFDLAEWNVFFLGLCPLYELLVLPFPQLLRRWHICICAQPVSCPETSCNLLVGCVKRAMTSSALPFHPFPSIPHCSACFSVPTLLFLSLSLSVSLWCRGIIHTHQLRADCRESQARTHLQRQYITVRGTVVTAHPD